MARDLSDEEKQILSTLSDKYDGLVKPFLIKDTLVVVRAASAGDLHRYKDKIAAVMAASSKARRGPAPSVADAERELALSCIVHPEPAKAKALCESRPGFFGTAATAAEELASDGVEELEGN
jgi:hypothetical protein